MFCLNFTNSGTSITVGSFSFILKIYSSSWDMHYEQMERFIIDTEIPYTFVRCGLMMQILKYFRDDMKDGALPINIADGKFAPLHANDGNT